MWIVNYLQIFATVIIVIYPFVFMFYKKLNNKWLFLSALVGYEFIICALITIILFPVIVFLINFVENTILLNILILQS